MKFKDLKVGQRFKVKHSNSERYSGVGIGGAPTNSDRNKEVYEKIDSMSGNVVIVSGGMGMLTFDDHVTVYPIRKRKR